MIKFTHSHFERRHFMKTKRTLKVSLLSLMLALCMLIGLSSCGLFCKHEWKDATCTDPKTCALCSKTEGDALGHTGGNATCTQKAVCSVCGAEYGELAAHTFTEEIVKDEALKAEASCTNAETYYKSCACGAISTNAADVFFVGTVSRHQYENNVCTVCGFDATTPYYLNFVSSFGTTDRISVKLNNLVIENEIVGTVQNATLKKLSSVDVAELEIYIDENGQLGGAAHGKFKVSTVGGMDVEATLDFKAIIDGGYLYVTYAGNNLKLSLEELLSDYLGSTEDITASIPTEVLDFATQTLAPMIETLLEENKASINDLIGCALNIFFTFEDQADGSVLVTLSRDKLLALNEALATKSVAEVIDIYFGANTFEGIVDSVFEILDLKLCDVPTYLKDNGIDYDTLVAKIEELLPLLGAPEGLDIDELLKNSEISNNTIGMLVFGTEDNSYKAEMEENFVQPLRETSVYELINAPETFADQVNDAIGQICDSLTLSIATQKDGAFTSVHVDLNKMAVSGSSDSFGNSSNIYATLSLDVVANGKINVTWSNIIEQINTALVPIPEEAKKELECRSNEDFGWTETVDFQNTTYECQVYYVTVYQRDFDSVSSITATQQKDNWVLYNVQVAQTEYDYELLLCEENGETQMFIRNGYTWEIAKLEATGSGFNAIYEDDTTKNIIISNEDTMMLTTAKLYPMLFDEIYAEDGWGTVSYYYNTSTGEYSMEYPLK